MMKTILIILVAIILGSCGGTSKTEKTLQEELVIADSVSQIIENQRAELSEKTQETLNEVDSLLENL